MSVSRQELAEAMAIHTSLMPVMNDDHGGITAVTVEIEGKSCCVSAARRNRRVMYRVFMDVSNLAQRIPTVWVLSPKDDEIEHVNVFRASSSSATCAMLGKRLPTLCWGNAVGKWQRTPVPMRRLTQLLSFVGDHLNHSNMNDKARS